MNEPCRRRAIYAAQKAEATPKPLMDELIPPSALEILPKNEAPKAEKVDPHACPKCGRIVKQGKYLHIKFCKGK